MGFGQIGVKGQGQVLIEGKLRWQVVEGSGKLIGDQQGRQTGKAGRNLDRPGGGEVLGNLDGRGRRKDPLDPNGPGTGVGMGYGQRPRRSGAMSHIHRPWRIDAGAGKIPQIP